MNTNYGTRVNMLSYSMEAVSPEEKTLPYISLKNVGSLLNLNYGVEAYGETIVCSHLSSLLMLNSIDYYNNCKKIKVNEFFMDIESVKRVIPENIKEIYPNIVQNSCGRHIIACSRFGNFLHKIASSMSCCEQRFFLLHSCNHVMYFRIMHKTKESCGASLNKWVVHFFDPNITNVVTRSEVLDYESFLDQEKFSLQMFISKDNYKLYFGNSNSGIVDHECLIQEYSDKKPASLKFLTLETLSQYGISGCMIYHIMSDNISSFNIMEAVKHTPFRTLSSDIRREIFLAKSSSNVTALYASMERNRPNSIKSYNDFLQELSYDEQLSLLPEIINDKSSSEATALFIAMQEGHAECVSSFGLLIDRLINIRPGMTPDNFCNMLFDVFLSVRNSGFTALSLALYGNHADAILAFGNLMNRIFIVNDNIGNERLSDMIFGLLHYKSYIGTTGLFLALSRGCYNAIIAFGTLIDKLLVMKGRIPDINLANMIFILLMAKDGTGSPGLFFAFQGEIANTVSAFGLLIDRLLVMKGHIPDINLANMIFELLMAKDGTGVPGVFFAFQEGNADIVCSFGLLIDRLLVMKGHIPDIDLANMIFRLLIAKDGTGVSGLYCALKYGHADTVMIFGLLVDRLLVMKDSVSYLYISSTIFELLMSKDNTGSTGLFIALQEGHAEAVLAFGSLIDRLLLMKGYVPDAQLADMVFDLLMCKSSDGVPGLFVAMKNGHATSITAFCGLLERIMLFKNDIYSEYFDHMLTDIVMSKQLDGTSGLFVALKNNYPDVVRSYAPLLNLIPETKVVDVLIAFDNHGTPAALLAGKEALYSYLELISLFSDDVMSVVISTITSL
ncbi:MULTISPECIES: ShET2/EspL2 family type III secretion system effector toxin [Candidatus Ichthyocystis]|uniref:ShET2/EspL2 family type III secretion system effector toxin n=1 Tax=Candidatus Ichthyocystis TaxID=2929841 RepID=UPI000B865B4A|nr:MULTISPECIES: ShET2/EspL2 family type III secretion system effector toxin [Ichthyocystis]